jgi:hypothetical protein
MSYNRKRDYDLHVVKRRCLKQGWASSNKHKWQGQHRDCGAQQGTRTDTPDAMAAICEAMPCSLSGLRKIPLGIALGGEALMVHCVTFILPLRAGQD